MGVGRFYLLLLFFLHTQVEKNGGGKFTEVTLNPKVIVKESSMFDKATELHRKANELCFIANSVNFPIHHNPSIKITEY